MRLVTAGLDKPLQHTHWWDMSPEDSMLTLNLHCIPESSVWPASPPHTEHGTEDSHWKARSRHGGQPREEHEHKSSGEHRSPTHDREKSTSQKPSINSPSGALYWLPLFVWLFTPLHWWRIREDCEGSPTSKRFFLFSFFSPAPFVFFSE